MAGAGARGETLPPRASEVLTAHFRAKESEEEDDFTDPEKLSLDGTAWVTPLDVEIFPAQVLAPPAASRFAFLGESETVDGAAELRRVGRCLDHLYPDDLDRVLLREREMEELTRFLRGPQRRPVLLLGPPLVGKTALLHEYVHRATAARKDPYRVHNNVWLLSPQRLISGMSFVGQWENRLLAILKEARKRDHILYFDDVLGLYQAGRTSQSDLSVAHVLKPYIERREVRLAAEMTPEALRVWRERDRGFADLFQVLPLREPADEETLRILIAVCRQLEGQQRMLLRHRRVADGPRSAATVCQAPVISGQGRSVPAPTIREAPRRHGGAKHGTDGVPRAERADAHDAGRQPQAAARGGAEIIASGRRRTAGALEAAADVIGVAKCGSSLIRAGRWPRCSFWGRPAWARRSAPRRLPGICSAYQDSLLRLRQ